MKSHAGLWPRVTSFENLYEAFRRARKGKRSRPDVAAFEFDLERNLLALQRELLDGSYRPSGYRNFVVHEPTLRKISAAPFRDRVVHHALCQVIEPLFERTLGSSIVPGGPVSPATRGGDSFDGCRRTGGALPRGRCPSAA